MAENPIDKNSIFDFDGTKKGIEEIISLLKEFAGVLEGDLKKSADEWVKSLQGVNINTKEGQELITKAATAAKDLAAQQRELTKLDKDLTTAKTKLSGLEKESVQNKIREVSETKKAIQEKQKEITQGKAAADSYVAMTRRLKEMRDAWRMAGEEGRKNLSPQIQKLNQELKNLDSTVGNHQRNVGNYGSALKGMGRQMLTAVGITGGITMAVKGFRAVLDSTQAAGDTFRAFLGGASEAGSHLARAISNMDFSNLIEGMRSAFYEGKRYAEMLDLIGDLQRSLGIQLIDADIEIARQRAIARDRRLDIKEREAAIEEIIRLEQSKVDKTQVIAEMSLDNEIKNIQARVDINKETIVDFISNHEDYLDQLEAGAALEKRLEDEATERGTKTIASAKTGQVTTIETAKLNEKKHKELLSQLSEEEKFLLSLVKMDNEVVDSQRDRINAAIQGSKRSVLEQAMAEELLVGLKVRLHRELIRETGESDKENNKEVEDRIKAATAAREAKSREQQKSMVDQAKNSNVQIVDDALKTQKELGEIRMAEVKVNEDAAKVERDFRREMNRETLRDQIAAAENSMQALSDASLAIGDLMMAQKQRELNAAGDNAQKREEIERKYFKREQALAIASAIINGALAITKVTAQTGILAPLTIPLIIASTLGQIAVIASQKFAEGGFTGKGLFRDETGERVAGIVHEDEFVIDKKQTRRYRPLLEAIHKNDTHGIAINSNHYEVWGRANDAMDFRQDPYTQKMYELMKSQPVMYSDSNGDLVLRWNGRVQVIKKN